MVIYLKKFIFFWAILFLSITTVQAEENSAYIDNLEINNFELSPKFDKYNNTYSVNVDENTTKLIIDYSLEDPKAEVEILNNELIIEEESIVYINVTNKEVKQTYKIIVNKNKEQNVASIDNTQLDLSVEKKYNLKLVLTAIIIGWLLIVYIAKKILFPHKKIKKKKS